MQIVVTPDVIASVKADLRTSLPSVKSSHRMEAIARGFGWSTNVAMMAPLAAGPTTRKVGTDAFTAYLSDHGFPAANRVLPNAVLRLQVCAVAAAHPELTDYGFGVPDERRIGQAERHRRYAEGRAAMVKDSAVEEFERAGEFLQQLEKTRAPTRVFHTYKLKYSTERWHSHWGTAGRWSSNYVSNGMLLVAALHLRFQVQRESPTSFAGFLNVSTRSVRAVEDRRKPPLPQVQNGKFFRPLGHLSGKFFYVAAGENRVITLRAVAHTPTNLMRLAPLDYWTRNFPSRDRRAPFDVYLAAGELFRRCGDAGFFDPEKFQRTR